MRRRFRFAVLLASLPGLFGSAFAEDPRHEPQRKVIHLSLRHVVALAVANNHDINLSRLDPLVAQSDEIFALASFDPKIVSQTTFQREHQRTSSILSSGSILRQDTTQFLFGIRKTMPVGTQLEFDYTVDRFETSNSGAIFFQNFLLGSSVVNPNYTSKISLRLTQPLLRNFGLAENMTDVRSAQSRRRAAQARFEDTVRRTVAKSIETYWNLVEASEIVQLEQETLERARDLLAITQAKRESGSVEPLQVISAEVEVARKEADVFAAREEMIKIEDQLKLLLLPSSLRGEPGAVLIPIAPPQLQQEMLELPENVRRAIEARPDLAALREEVENARILVRKARSNILPILNAKVEGGWSGTAKSMGQSIKDLSGGDVPYWGFGMEFELPIGNRAARSEFRKARLELRRAQLASEQLRVEIIAEIRANVRSLQTQKNRIGVQHKALELSRKQLKIEKDRFRLGVTKSNKRVIDFQSDLTAARRNKIQAIIRYKNAAIRLRLARGSSIRSFLRDLPIP